MVSCKLILVFLFEMIATFFYVALACGGITGKDVKAESNLLGLNLGLASLVVVHIFGFLSGAVLNPTVTVASFISGLIAWDRALSFLIAQFGGALAAYYFLIFALGEAATTGATLCLATGEGLEDKQIAGIEFLITALLMFSLLAMVDKRNKADILPLRYGATIAALTIVGVLNNGIGLNSALMVAAAQANNNFEKLPIYLGGQFAAAVVVPLIWKFFIAKKPKCNPCSPCPCPCPCPCPQC